MNTQTFGASVVGSLCTMIMMGALVLGFQAIADQNPTTDSVPRLIPYNGTLEFNGQPLTKTGEEAPWLKFELIDNSPVGGQEAQIVYEQTMQVNIYGGKFTAMLGPADDLGVNINTVMEGGDDILLQTTILGNHDVENPETTADDDVTLSNPQRLVMSPFAMWATNATNFNVANRLQANHINVAQDLTMNAGVIQDNDGPVVVDDELQVNRALNMHGEVVLNTNASIRNSAGPVLINDELSVQNNVTLNGGSLSDSNGPVAIDDTLHVTGDLTLGAGVIRDDSGPVHINDELRVDNALTASSANIIGAASIGTANITGTGSISTANITTANISTANITTANISTLDVSNRNVRVFGAWSEGYAFETTYTAPTDGIVVAYAKREGAGRHIRLNGYSPTDTLRARAASRVEAGDVAISLMMPVRKGDTWDVYTFGSVVNFNESKISFLKLGN